LSRLRYPRLSSAAFCLGIAATAAMLSFRPIYEPDLWWHLAQGRENAAGRIVGTNLFSFTYPDYRQTFTPWFFDTAMYGAWQAWRGTGIQVVQACLLSLTFVTLFAACRTRAPAWAAVTVLLLGVFVLEPRAIPRPHLVSFVGMAACMLMVERCVVRKSAAPLAWAVPTVAVWSNLHVECVFGVAVVALFAAAESIRPAALPRAEAGRALLIAALCTLATTANPYGWGLASYLYENLSVPQILTIAELRRAYLPDYRAFFAYVLVAGVLLALFWRTARLWEALPFFVFATLGVQHLRLTPLVLFVTAPMIAARLNALTARGIDYRAIVITGICLALACSRIPLRLLATELERGTAAVMPREFFSAQAIAFIKRAGLEGGMFNSHNLGGYLAWELYPRARVFQDSRLQAYPPEHFRSIILASQAQSDWNALIAGVDWAVISVPRPNQLSGHGRFPATEWRSVYLDEAIEVVVRRTGRYSQLMVTADGSPAK
jgi:hypothetical protein